jgi:hypothetical protein
VVAEATHVKGEQPMAMSILLVPKLLELLGLRGVIFLQPLREVILDACIFFLE